MSTIPSSSGLNGLLLPATRGGTTSPSNPANLYPSAAIQPAPVKSQNDTIELSQIAGLMSGLRAFAKADPTGFAELLTMMGSSLGNEALDLVSTGDPASMRMLAAVMADLADANHTGLAPQTSESE